MKLAISNIAWAIENDTLIFDWMKIYGYQGLEIAPTRTFKLGYDADETEKEQFCHSLESYGFELCSMQSLLFGYKEPIFSNDDLRERVSNELIKGMDFAQSLGITSLVFGSPSIRNVNNELEKQNAVDFFSRMANEAGKRGLNFNLEPNPVIYNTNFINRTKEALDFVKAINLPGLGINLDLGTVIFNEEQLEDIITEDNIPWIRHVHISEPNLVPINPDYQDLHDQLFRLLAKFGYDRFVSIEMKLNQDVKDIESILRYIRDVAIEAGVMNGK